MCAVNCVCVCALNCVSVCFELVRSCVCAVNCVCVCALNWYGAVCVLDSELSSYTYFCIMIIFT